MATRIRERRAKPTAAGVSGGLRMEQVDRAGPWEAYVVDLSGFPVRPATKAALHRLLGSVTETATDANPVRHHVFLQVNSLHIDDGSTVVSANGRDWVPMIGLGVPPLGPAPRIWNQADFEALMPGEAPPSLIHPMLHVSKAENSLGAREVMLGRGAVVQISGRLEQDPFLDALRSVIVPMLEDPTLHAYPLFVPLLDSRALSQAGNEDLDRWTAGGSLYVRECLEEKELVIAAKRPLAELLAAAGALKESGEGPPAWLLPE